MRTSQLRKISLINTLFITDLGANMSLMQWNSTLVLNIPTIDKQHQVLVKWMNLFHDKHLEGSVDDSIKALHSLAKYCVMHFEDEERMMVSYDYAEFTAHKATHTKLLKEVTDLITEYEKSPNRLNGDRVGAFLKNWLQNHILGTDKSYAEAMIEAGVE